MENIKVKTKRNWMKCKILEETSTHYLVQPKEIKVWVRKELTKPIPKPRKMPLKFFIFEKGIYDYYYNGHVWEKQVRISGRRLKRYPLNEEDIKYVEQHPEFYEIYARKSAPLPERKPGIPSGPGSCHNHL